ncbi:carbohydrate-binding module family 1 protein [Botryobasidium botryosum FD-172 SS1]|uniref:Carboxylic ester hydrolase n=1 Tax=Botryobasidium botryosum (strain FD-172 SS1) TaxID=930990 RepID=A0A067MV62_BOTB1|nr:carbohydrate-binding module family 1 protein [Botryobasidium botryosum FD-172 SS1]
MVRISTLFTSLTVTLLAAVGVDAAANQLTQVSNFGTNPTNVRMYLYRPTRVASPPPLLVAMHYCSGTAQAYFTGTSYANLADQYGYLVIYPNAPDSGGCWDVHSTATLTHNAGGDSLGIASMVRYAISTYGVDPNRVFMTGTSSGAMMTNVLAGAYPDLFKAGAAFAGVPYACFAGSGMWNSDCATGRTSKTAQAWGDLVRNGYPGYTGARPKLQIWHGTNDETLNYNNFGEAIKQWTNVFGVSTTPTSTQTNSPVNGWTRSSYGPNFQAISAQGVTHNIPVQANDVISWFGLNQPPSTSVPVTTPPVTTPPTGPTTTYTPPPTTTAPNTPLQTLYGQCGGIGWTGPKACASPARCVYSNDWYSQCLP